MSGHSKWAQIKRQKGVTDMKRAQAFTKLASAVTLAVKQGGGVADAEQNFRLRLAIDKARQMNMPKENIERAIDRAAGKGGNAAVFEEVVYEGYGPGGVAVIVDAATDNSLRTTAEVKNVFNKAGATLGALGSVSYMFQTKGVIIGKKEGKNVDDIFLLAADAGAEDMEEADESVFIYTKPDEVAKVKDRLVQEGFTVEDFELTRRPVMTKEITDKETAEKVLTFIDKLDVLDDVQRVYANFEIADAIL